MRRGKHAEEFMIKHCTPVWLLEPEDEGSTILQNGGNCLGLPVDIDKA
jgi:hypothetical protein